MSAPSPERGARNLLENCAGARAGERLLIVREAPELGYYDSAAADCLRDAAQRLGLAATQFEVGFCSETPQLTRALLAAFEQADIVVFLARLGDQLRFSAMPPGKRIIVSFAVNRHLLGSGFGTAHHHAFEQIKAAVDNALADAREVCLRCPAGTEVRGRPQMPAGPGGDTTIRRFPMSVFTPVPAATFSGRVALPGFLTGTGSRYYEGYTVEFDGPVLAHMRAGRLTGFTGADADVARARAQYDRIAARFGIDRDIVHSWHAGIHPGCGYPWDMRENYERWGGAAFGNPRVLHFHTCGAYAPGEISWNVIDPTVEIDGIAVWENGVFHLDRLPEGAAILHRYTCAAALFAAPDRQIGLAPTRAAPPP